MRQGGMGTQQRGKEVLEIVTVIPTNCHLLGAASSMSHVALHLQNFLHAQGFLKWHHLALGYLENFSHVHVPSLILPP